MNGPVNGMDSVTKGMERVSVQPPSQFSDRRIELTQDEDDWDWTQRVADRDKDQAMKTVTARARTHLCWYICKEIRK